jgi:molybdopterin/thiamine biosynthesis adenylyltransferase
MELLTCHLTRQMDILPLRVLGAQITIIGAGAIGSHVALALAKMGFNVKVIDFDTVTIENMCTSGYRYKDIGKPKVVALAEILKEFANIDIEISQERYTGDKAFPGIVIMAVDSMEVRSLIWRAHKKFGYLTKKIIDPRMSAEFASMYVVDPGNKLDQVRYEKTLYSDANAVSERCTAKATMYTAYGIAAIAVKDIVTDGNHSRTILWSLKDDQFSAWGRTPATQGA